MVTGCNLLENNHLQVKQEGNGDAVSAPPGGELKARVREQQS